MRTSKFALNFAASALALGLAACQSVTTPTTPGTASVAPATVPAITGSTGTTTGTGTTTTTATPAATGTPGTATATAASSLTPSLPGTAQVAASTLGTLTGPTTFTSASASQKHTLFLGAGTRYEANQPVTINDTVKVTRDPRDATYTVNIAQQGGGIVANTRYQDPAHRSDYLTVQGKLGTKFETTDYDLSALLPNIPNTEYYSSGSKSGNTPATTVQRTVFFTERMGNPNSSTQYVTWAAYWQYDASNDVSIRIQSLQRSEMVYGFNTLASNVPKVGSATYSGGLFADAVEGNTFYTITGRSNYSVDFANDKGTFALGGTFIGAGPNDISGAARLNTTFVATGSLVLARPSTTGVSSTSAGTSPIGVFSGKVDKLVLGGTSWAYLPNETKALSFQASSVEGGFFGPKAEEIGATFRIVGGTPNDRLDITGAITGRSN